MVFLLAARGPRRHETVGVVHDTVEDGVGDGWVAQVFVPFGGRELAGDDRGATGVSIFDDHEEITMPWNPRSPWAGTRTHSRASWGVHETGGGSTLGGPPLRFGHRKPHTRVPGQNHALPGERTDGSDIILPVLFAATRAGHL